MANLGLKQAWKKYLELGKDVVVNYQAKEYIGKLISIASLDSAINTCIIIEDDDGVHHIIPLNSGVVISTTEPEPDEKIDNGEKENKVAKGQHEPKE